MNRCGISGIFAKLLGGLALLACAMLALSGLWRMTVWATGSAFIHSDIQSGPEIFVWQVDDPAFGGLSALLIEQDGTALLSASDRGTYIAARIIRDDQGRISTITDPVLTPVSLASGRAPTNFKMDLEALARLPDGRLAQAFEGFVRLELLEAPEARPQPTHPWDQFVHLFGNQAFEALATLPDGRILAITEATTAPGAAASMIFDGTHWRSGPDIPVPDGFAVTGADVGPDGCLYLVERTYRMASGFTSRLRRLSGGAQGWDDTLLYQTPAAHLGNVEGVSVWRDGQDTIRLSMVTDDGFLPLTPTRLIELRAKPGANCQLEF